MGNVLSSASTRARASETVTINKSETMNNACGSREVENEHNEEQFFDTESDDQARARTKEEEMDEFRRQLSIKREQRKQILARHRSEREELEKTLDTERKAKLQLIESNNLLRELLLKNNVEIPERLMKKPSEEDSNPAYLTQMKEECDKIKTNNNKLRRTLAETNSSLQSAYSDIADLNARNTESIKQINALKEVVSVSKTMISLREEQLNELKNKLGEIERSLADREASMLSADLRKEYVRQLQNIRTLRALYEERSRLAEVTRQGLVRELEEHKVLYQTEVTKCKDLTTKVEELEIKIDGLIETIENKNEQITTSQSETYGLKLEMLAVNKLFSQVLLGYKTKQDLDKLVHRLEENHGLLTHMAEKENGSEASTALPKLLLELISQVDEGEDRKDSDMNSQNNVVNEMSIQAVKSTETQNPLNTSAQEIVENLPKVWRVLMELLSHQSEPEAPTTEKVTTCYKSVETKSGPVLVPSVSQTYIRLKDLIVEKLTLIKEVNRMKQLNNHLETRLEEQERRLCLVTTELSKTWHVVGRLRRHHHQLHTHEKILKYELQQKRKLLNELKEELEYCREKWEQAREKNSQSERDWRKLRAEFSSRKTKSNLQSLNNSAESGYSDERPSDDSSESNDESEYVTEPLVRCKKKIKKSFETIIDSSADFNLAAEREDPASDMLDVADLPLDTQEGDDNQEASVSVSDRNSENLLKNEKLCEETEDEIGDITDSCVDESSTAEHYCENDYCCVEQSTSKEDDSQDNKEDKKNPSKSTEIADLPGPTSIDPAKILENIKHQNERLAKKDRKLEHLEKNSAALLNKTQATIKLSEQINSTLDHLINRPTSSRQPDVEIYDTETRASTVDAHVPNSLNDTQKLEINTKVNLEGAGKETESLTVENVTLKNLEQNNNETVENVSTAQYLNSDECSQQGCADQNTEIKDKQSFSGLENSFQIDSKAVLESVKRQNERLEKRDERLQNLEEGSSQVVNSMSKTLSFGDEIIKKLNALHVEHPGEGSNEKTITESRPSSKGSNNSTPSRDESEPSTSSEIDHEARFAARDRRLKRLEEQTKSLVSKVNKTTSKGVKINYKLDELHNIYGSESSRAGTPSEDCEEHSPNNDNESPDE